MQIALLCLLNTLVSGQNGSHFPYDTFKRIFLNQNVRILIKIPLKFVPKGPINNIPALVQIMAWRRPSDKPLSELMMFSLLTHISGGVAVQLYTPIWDMRNSNKQSEGNKENYHTNCRHASGNYICLVYESVLLNRDTSSYKLSMKCVDIYIYIYNIGFNTIAVKLKHMYTALLSRDTALTNIDLVTLVFIFETKL